MQPEIKSRPERRQKPRMDDPIPVDVKGSHRGKGYRFGTITRNLGSGGLCAFAPRMMELGEPLSMRIRFARPGSKTVQAPEVSVRGRVVRVEQRPGGFCLFAAAFFLR